MTSQMPLTILIVDDSPEDRAVCSHFLRRHPAAVYVCIEAATGLEGLALCQSASPDCLMLDFSLPDMDGLEFLTALQAQASPQRCPVNDSRQPLRSGLARAWRKLQALR